MVEAKVKLNKWTKRILRKVRKKGVAHWQGDDSPLAFKVFEEVWQEAYDCGMVVFRNTSVGPLPVKKTDVSAGHFCVVGLDMVKETKQKKKD